MSAAAREDLAGGVPDFGAESEETALGDRRHALHEEPLAEIAKPVELDREVEAR